jgi:RHS repeat-associated protein
LSAWLDNQPVSVTGIGTNAMQWRAMMELSAGTHQLKVAAAHPSGQFTAWTTNTFTNSIAYQTTGDTFDNAGYITNRVWKNANGTTNRTQTLSWDARGRLHSVIDRDASQNGQNFTVVYDALGRRLQTTQVIVSNGVAMANLPVVVNHYFDPLYEFQELGVTEGSQTTWRLMGPDMNGKYGAQNGTGGLDGISPYLNLFYPTIADMNGNILGMVTNGVVTWNSSRLTAYGAVPDYRPLSLGVNGSLASKYAWRNRATESIGLVWLGANWYDPVSGRFMSPDPLGHDANVSLYNFCSGNPLGYWDADGRLGKQFYGQANAAAGWTVDLAVNTVAGAGYLLDQGAYLATGDPGFGAAAQQWQSEMSPYAKQGYYNPNTPTAQLATAATMFVDPESVAGRLGGVESTVVRDATQAGVITDPARMLPAPQQPAGLLAETTGGSSDVFEYYMNQAKTLDVSTSQNGAVFYSGTGNRALAEQFAIANGKTTLEMTPGGGWLDQQQLFNPATSPLSSDQAAQVWSQLSQRYAAGASGTAVGFVNGANAGSIFNTVEFPALLNNKSINNIITGGH